MKSKIFETILTQVAETTELKKEEIVGKVRKAELIEARMLVIYFCKEYGISISYLQEKMNRKSPFAISHLLCGFDYLLKQSYSFREAHSELKQKFANILPKT
jgi:hypothetical protein